MTLNEWVVKFQDLIEEAKEDGCSFDLDVDWDGCGCHIEAKRFEIGKRMASGRFHWVEIYSE